MHEEQAQWPVWSSLLWAQTPRASGCSSTASLLNSPASVFASLKWESQQHLPVVLWICYGYGCAG